MFLPRHRAARDYARQCLRVAGVAFRAASLPDTTDHPAIAWAQAGLLPLCGYADGPALMCPAPLAAAADGALMALAVLAGHEFADTGAGLLGQRARHRGLVRQGKTAPGGACVLLPCRDGYIAANFARPEDTDLFAAWLEDDAITDVAAAKAAIRHKDQSVLAARAQLLGLPVAIDPSTPPAPRPWYQVIATGPESRVTGRKPRVVDLSSLWAGPLAAQLLRQTGAEILKIESRQRPDGARLGDQAFFNQLNSGKAHRVLDLTSHHDLAALRQLILSADIVIESARPRALRQLGIDARDCLAQKPGLTWVSITGYGSDVDNAVAFGDDAGVAAGLTRLMRRAHGRGVFVGDAIADPMAGLHAALIAYGAWRLGGGRLIQVPLVDVMINAIGEVAFWPLAALRRQARGWQAIADGLPTSLQ